MAFSFRVGTNWCHDFPKLARESGFYFNMHRNRVRVDWNRICSIDVDRVIRERDFLTVDENVNNVIDYSLEGEYDVKILDPNFVKLFRLAQLAVEYLLYCKQYLDQSVIILKEELHLKIEENLKLKKGVTTADDQIRNLTEKLKDRDRALETKIGDSHCEIHKCPQCAKTFISALFVRAHISRRHPTLSEAFTTSSPAHEEYRAETEKLHNEIKTLKERLNQTERVIRNESNKATQNISMSSGFRTNGYDSMKTRNDSQDSRMEEHHKRYQEEIISLKTMLFSELRNVKLSGLKDIGLSGLHYNDSVNMKELIRQQEKEIHKLRNQAHDNVTPDLQSMQNKLLKQGQYWKTKLDHIESQHRSDIENVFAQLKLTQQAANCMKRDYESKVNVLQKQTISQPKVLTAQHEHLSNISRSVEDAHAQDHSEFESSSALKYTKEKYSKNNFPSNIPKCSEKIKFALKNDKESSKNSKRTDLIFEDLDSVFSQEPKNTLQENLYSRVPENKKVEITTHEKMKKSSGSGFITSENSNSVLKLASNEENLGRKSPYENYSKDTVVVLESNVEKLKRKSKRKNNLEKFHSQATKSTTKLDVRESKKKTPKNNHYGNFKGKENKLKMPPSTSQSEESELSSETETESETSVTESEGLLSESLDENSKINKLKSPIFNKFNKQILSENPLSLNELKNNLQNNFDDQLRKLGIDPEWIGIPKATYKEKVEILKHQKKLYSKKFMVYEKIRKKLLADVSAKLCMRQNQPQKYESVKKSFLNKMMNNVKSRAMKALNMQKTHITGLSVLRSRDSTQRTIQPKQKFGMDLLPRKLTDFDFRERRRDQHNRPVAAKRIESQIDSSPTPTPTPRRSSIHVDRIVTSRFQNSRELTDSNLSLKKLSHSYESIKDFLGQVNEESRKSNPALDMMSAKVTSTPNRNVNNIMQDSFSTAMNDQETIHSLTMSSKNNKSVLKPTTGSVGSLVKKKVLFDLKGSPDKDSLQMKSLCEILTGIDSERKELNDSDWNISSISEEKDQTFHKGKSKSMDNIVLKTSQSDKIAQISMKVEKQPSMARKKPAVSIEAMFLTKSPLKSFYEQDHVYQNTSATNSILKSPEHFFEDRFNVNNKTPQADPRASKNRNVFVSSKQMPDTNDSDLDLDINELLEIE